MVAFQWRIARAPLTENEPQVAGGRLNLCSKLYILFNQTIFVSDRKL